MKEKSITQRVVAINAIKSFCGKSEKIKCKGCDRIRPHKAFGLCGGCHVRLYHYDLTKSYNARKWHNINFNKYKELTKTCASCCFDKLITLHHLDGNKKNNDEKNLVGLCPNCHKMIHTYQYYREIRERLQKRGFEVENIHPSNYVK